MNTLDSVTVLMREANNLWSATMRGMKVGRRQGEPGEGPSLHEPAAARPAPLVRPLGEPSLSVTAHDGEIADRDCTVHEGMRRLVQLLPRVVRGLRRRPDEPVEVAGVQLGPRHGSALALIREGATTVGTLAAALDLNLATVSGLVADLERVDFVERSTDPADRRRTIVGVAAGQEELVDLWLEGATAPIVRALQMLSSEERATFVKAMGYLEAELNAGTDRVL
jgi:DNA-binding MarR family transcriptional regulator